LCGTKNVILPVFQQMAELEYQAELDLAQMPDSSIQFTRSLLVLRGDKRALEIFDSFNRVRELLAEKRDDYDLTKL
jgi:hypothetical protein